MVKLNTEIFPYHIRDNKLIPTFRGLITNIDYVIHNRTILDRDIMINITNFYYSHNRSWNEKPTLSEDLTKIIEALNK